MAKRKSTKTPSPAQHIATMTNLCLANLGRQISLFQRAGHHDFEMLTKDLDAKFRAKLKGMKK